MNLVSRIKQSSRELIIFAAAALTLGMAFSMVDATFNNFLNDRFALSGFERSFLEFPRELPGFLVVFVSAALWFLCSRRLGVVTMILSAAGARSTAAMTAAPRAGATRAARTRRPAAPRSSTRGRR